ncbi:3',5'-cyclic-AMP phosphodiesterase [Orbaceae bacterium ESL0727]|nr:3',5'-cyclic-AMP phosphodiesterase [Orbaceae bacterium ESL0727]
MSLASHLSLCTTDEDKGKILHITDMHLFANQNDTLLGVNSDASFSTVIHEIKNRHRSIDSKAAVDSQKQFDLIIATGDFVQDGSQKGYERFAQKIVQFNTPCVWLAGNHDVYSSMQNIFNAYQLADNKVILFGQQWLIILLNSQVVGQAYGFLPPSELDLLQHTLNRYPERSALLFMHHHPITSGCHWLDEHALKNSADLSEIIQNNKQIKGIGWGHIHQQQDKMWHHCFAFSTPSTCVQFEPECHHFKLSNEDSPGWREIELSTQGTIESKVYRINNELFRPDMSQNGY